MYPTWISDRISRFDDTWDILEISELQDTGIRSNPLLNKL